MDTIAMTAVYPHDAAYARAHGELAEYRNARRSNIACKNAIEEAIAKHFDGMHLDEACVKEVLDQYGSERVTLVLAATVQEKVWDGRFSNANKRWALEKEIPCEPDRWSAYAVAAHPVILNDFINLVRQEMQKRERPPAAKPKKRFDSLAQRRFRRENEEGERAAVEDAPLRRNGRGSTHH